MHVGAVCGELVFETAEGDRQGRQLLGDVVVQLARDARAFGLLGGDQAARQVFDAVIAFAQCLLITLTDKGVGEELADGAEALRSLITPHLFEVERRKGERTQNGIPGPEGHQDHRFATDFSEALSIDGSRFRQVLKSGTSDDGPLPQLPRTPRILSDCHRGRERLRPL